MVNRSFWYRARTGEEIPVEPCEDVCLPLFDQPRRFGLHEEMLDEARQLGMDASDHALVSLAVANGWALVDAAHQGSSAQVIAPSEDQARIAVCRLQLHVHPTVITLETLDEGLQAGRRIVEIQGWKIQRFVDGTPLHALQQDD